MLHDEDARRAIEGVDIADDGHTGRGPYITTYTGRFYFNDPRPEDVRLSDIAHSLARIIRYSGHGDRECRVAEHSVHIYRSLVAQNASREERACGLLHDSPETLSGFGDVASPRKRLVPAVGAAEDLIWVKAIAPRFGLPLTLPGIVHVADRRICADEMAQNMAEVDPNVGPPLGIKLEYWGAEQAEAEFLRAARELELV